MSNKYLVLGATGGMGYAFTRELLRQGIETDILARNRVKAEKLFHNNPLLNIHVGEVHDAGTLQDVAAGMDVIFHGINFPYQQWHQLMKPVTSLVIKAARQNGSTILFPGNIYAYGNIEEPIREEIIPQPGTKKGKLRLEVENILEKATEDGQCSVINLRLPDFFGPNVTNGLIKPLFGNAALGKSMTWMVCADVPHQFVYTPDAAQLFYRLSRETNLPPYYMLNYGGEVVPSVTALSTVISREAGSPNRLRLYSKTALKILGWFVPVVRELNENIYQFESCIELDDSRIRSKYPEFEGTRLEEAIKETINWYRSNNLLAYTSK
jgi:nucleoside-diphosphate-sugar epimerase